MAKILQSFPGFTVLVLGASLANEDQECSLKNQDEDRAVLSTSSVMAPEKLSIVNWVSPKSYQLLNGINLV